MECIPLSSLCVGHQKGWIRVRASRVWNLRANFSEGQFTGMRLVLVDEEGNSIYASVPCELVNANMRALHESVVYEFSLFEVSDHGRHLRPVDNPLVITFTELTVVQPVHSPDDMFPEITYRLTSFADLPEPAEVPRHFLDVIGVIRGVSEVATIGLSGSNPPLADDMYCSPMTALDSAMGSSHADGLPLFLLDQHWSPEHFAAVSDNEIRVTLLDEAAFRFNGRVIRSLAQEESAIVIFVGTVLRSHEGSKELVGAAPCRWYINRDMQDINILRARFQSSFRPIARLPIPLPMGTLEGGGGWPPVDSLSSILSYDFVQNQPRRFRCVVKVWRLTPGRRWWLICCARCGRSATPAASTLTETNRYICSDVGCPCIDATLEYCLHLLCSDNTGQAEFNLRGRIAQDVIRLLPRQTILNNCPRDVPVTNLGLAASQIIHTPPELAWVASWNYQFLIHVTANSFQAGWASLDVCAVEACYPFE